MKFVWKNKTLGTMGDVIEVMEAVYECGDQKEADKFMETGEKCGQHFKDNIGYMTGYFNPKTGTGMRKLFNVKHPIFGDRTPTIKEAFESGRNMARAGRGIYGIEK